MAGSISYRKADDQVLSVKRYLRPNESYETMRVFVSLYDFEFRTMTAISNYGNSAREQASVIPFSQLDEDVLERMRDKLVELGGKPAPLRGESAADKKKFPAPQSLRPGNR
ncbi:MAG: hypothetical protein GC185_05740 [Alphaproteobacteria bacterium]|nr:hypothetical protein [Alphaproteobacteria bacterium]